MKLTANERLELALIPEAGVTAEYMDSLGRDRWRDVRAAFEKMGKSLPADADDEALWAKPPPAPRTPIVEPPRRWNWPRAT